MTYKKVTPISKGVLRIRSEPDESGRVCGSVSYGGRSRSKRQR